MPAAGGEPDDLQRLKALLFGAEARRLADAEARLSALESRLGDAARFDAALARALPEIFRRTEGEQASALAGALARAIRAEPSAVADALRPLAGRLVLAALARAPRAAFDAIDRRLDPLDPSPPGAARRGRRWTILAVLAVLLLGSALWIPIERASKSAAIEAALAAARAGDARLAAYPLAVSEDWSANVATLSGLAPSREALSELVDAIAAAAAPLALETRVEIVASAEALRAEQARAAGLGAALSAKSAELQAIAGRLAAAEQVGSAFGAEIAALRSADLQAGKTLGALSEASKRQRGEIQRLTTALDALNARLDRVTGVSEAETLGLGEANAAQSLGRLADDLGGLAARAGEARARAQALGAALPGAADPALRSEAEALAAALAEAKAGEASAEAALRLEADRARRRAAMAQELKQSLAAATLADLARETRIAFAAGDAFADPGAAAQAISRLAAAIRRSGAGLRVVGLARAGDTPAVALATAKARADRVARDLAMRGAPAALVAAAARQARADEEAGVAFEPLAP